MKNIHPSFYEKYSPTFFPSIHYQYRFILIRVAGRWSRSQLTGRRQGTWTESPGQGHLDRVTWTGSPGQVSWTGSPGQSPGQGHLDRVTWTGSPGQVSWTGSPGQGHLDRWAGQGHLDRVTWTESPGQVSWTGSPGEGQSPGQVSWTGRQTIEGIDRQPLTLTFTPTGHLDTN